MPGIVGGADFPRPIICVSCLSETLKHAKEIQIQTNAVAFSKQNKLLMELTGTFKNLLKCTTSPADALFLQVKSCLSCTFSQACISIYNPPHSYEVLLKLSCRDLKENRINRENVVRVINNYHINRFNVT